MHAGGQGLEPVDGIPEPAHISWGKMVYELATTFIQWREYIARMSEYFVDKCSFILF